MRPIDADALNKHLRGACVAKYPSTFLMGLLAAANETEAAPTVDAVEVVRCKDCKHIENSPYGRYCTVWHGHNGMGDEGFCNYGERKSDGT